jgi:hypothetical protein
VRFSTNNIFSTLENAIAYKRARAVVVAAAIVGLSAEDGGLMTV